MTVVHGTLTGPGGGRPQAAAVTITLVDLEGQPVIGFTTAAEVVGTTTPAVGDDGTWTATLTPTGDITSPRGATLYRVDETSSTGRAHYYISVPSSGTPWVGSLRVTLPGNAAEALAGYLPLAGGTLTGPLILADASPAASEAYVQANGGGASLAKADSGYITSGNISAGTAFTQLGPDLTVSAAASDVLLIDPDLMTNNTGSDLQLEAASQVSAADTNWWSSGNGTSRWPGGIGSWYVPTGDFTGNRGGARYTVQAGDIVGGLVTARLYGRVGAGSRTVFANVTYALRWTLTNLNA